MNRDFGRAPRWALAAIVAASLGFGAAQAAAAPALVRPAARHCDATKCDETCKRNIPGSTGVCVGGTSGHCDCLLGP